MVHTRTFLGMKAPSPDQKFLKIQEHLRLGRRAEAVGELRTILRDHPAHISSVVTITEMLLQEQKNKEAMEIVDKALKVVPNEAMLLTLKASVFQNQGEMYT